MILGKREMAMDERTLKKEDFTTKVENAMKNVNNRGPGSEHDDGEELGDDDVPD